MFERKKYITEENLLNALQIRDYEIKKRVDEVYNYLINIRDLHNNKILKLDNKIEEINEKTTKKEETKINYEKSENLYTIYDAEDQVTHTFEEEYHALNYFKNKIWQKKAFKANKNMWEIICEAIKDEDIELAEDEINDK